MKNYEKYFGSIDDASKTLENIIFKNKNICENFCALYNDCEKHLEFMDNYDCIDGIKYFLNMEVKENKNAR